MTKQEKIKEAYGNYADVAMELCDENGWISKQHYYTYFPQDREEKMFASTMVRPKSLSGIENNNGWVKIESENDLPKENEQHYWTITENNPDIKERYFNKFFNEYKGEGKVTHYQPIEKPQSPIY